MVSMAWKIPNLEMESFYLNILSFCYSVDMEHAQATNNRRVHKGGGVFQQFRGGFVGKPKRFLPKIGEPLRKIRGRYRGITNHPPLKNPMKPNPRDPTSGPTESKGLFPGPFPIPVAAPRAFRCQDRQK